MRGLHIPGAIVIGRAPCSGNAGGADLSDADLTAARIDRRVKFQCASHRAYYAADGTIQFAEPDVWPLEYRNGQPAGRHEPEGQGTNLSTVNVLAGNWTQGNTSILVEDAGAGLLAGYPARRYTTTGGWSRACVSAPIPAASQATITALIKREQGSAPMLRFFSADVDYRIQIDVSTLEFTTNTDQVTTRASVVGDWVIASATCASPGALNAYLYPFFNGDNGKFATFCGWQVEASGLSTSPIGAAVNGGTRAAAFATVTNPGGQATAIRVHYSDGTTTDIEFAADGSDIQLPQSTTNWGTRYITRIQYARGF